jgi:hypothetical protein
MGRGVARIGKIRGPAEDMCGRGREAPKHSNRVARGVCSNVALWSAARMACDPRRGDGADVGRLGEVGHGGRTGEVTSPESDVILNLLRLLPSRSASFQKVLEVMLGHS